MSEDMDSLPGLDNNGSDDSGEPGGGGAWGSSSYAQQIPGHNLTVNLTTDEILEMMLGPKQVSLFYNPFSNKVNSFNWRKKLFAYWVFKFIYIYLLCLCNKSIYRWFFSKENKHCRGMLECKVICRHFCIKGRNFAPKNNGGSLLSTSMAMGMKVCVSGHGAMTNLTKCHFINVISFPLLAAKMTHKQQNNVNKFQF